MGEYKLEFAVRTLEGKELLPAGTILNEGLLKELSASCSRPETKSASLLEYGTIKQDLMDFFCQPPYDAIFCDKEQIDAIFETVRDASQPLPVLEALDFFRRDDFYTYRHMLLVFALSIQLARELLLIGDHRDLMRAAFASPAHDFGKICVPMDVLKKKNPLTLEQRHMLEHHALAGYVLLRYYNRDVSQLSARIARDHHERKDGSGYPLGIRLEERVVEVVLVSDVYDALISPRPYRPSPYNNRTALEEICQKAEQGKMSWDVVKALVAVNRKARPHYSQCDVSKEKRGSPPPGNAYGITADDPASLQQS
jgi:HD-GYP domain-containing protein (c-di-GMP phosphodiesterase class II)